MAFMSYFHGPLPSPQVCLCARVCVFEPVQRLKIERSTYAQTIEHAYSAQDRESEKMTQMLPYQTEPLQIKLTVDCEGRRIVALQGLLNGFLMSLSNYD